MNKSVVIQAIEALSSPRKSKDESIRRVGMMAYTDDQLIELHRLLTQQCSAQRNSIRVEAEKLTINVEDNDTGLADNAYAFQQAAPLSHDLKKILKEDHEIVVDLGELKQVLADMIVSQQ